MKLKFYASHEEQENARREYFASLTPVERLEHMRKAINIAYGMAGININTQPGKRKFTITGYIK